MEYCYEPVNGIMFGNYVNCSLWYSVSFLCKVPFVLPPLQYLHAPHRDHDPQFENHYPVPLPLTCLALLRASSRCRPRSSERCTSLSQRACTLSSRFLISTTSCFRLAKRSWEPAFSRARTCSRWVFTSFTNT